MNAPLYVDIIRVGLLPFIHDKFPENHRFMQDNDPKHCSILARNFFEDNGINWWKTVPESPDLNPIKNLWHELKEFVRREVKPTTKQQLIDGIKLFWSTVDSVKCTKYVHTPPTKGSSKSHRSTWRTYRLLSDVAVSYSCTTLCINGFFKNHYK